ncbi:MAG TPA: S8 family serine peptidase [Solirubrobacteraceae bacterium]|jgi:hypothetical protein|nr:S8 family serine peptidase [Solirubrobacteraceae bacterium]
MDHRPLSRAARSPLTLLATLCLALPASAAADAAGAPSPATASTPSPATHRISALCAEPPPEHSGCLGLRLASDEPATEHKSPIPRSLSPANVLAAYGLSGVTPPSTQTIALVDAYDDATAEADLAKFDSRFGLPACTEANGCFRKVNQNGAAAPLPASSRVVERGWAQEIATDVEVAHGVCQSCRMLLVEANSNENSDLYAAEQTAVALGANEISNSWGGKEPGSDNRAFNHPGVVITAAAGDEGYLDWLTGKPSKAAQYPASSPHVISVGGTRLARNAETGAWEEETVWNDGGASGGLLEGAGAGGGGCSARFAATSWQQSVPDWSSVGCGSMRAVADVAADADPYTGVAVYDSTETPEGEKGWAMIGGTSVASPIIASVFALAGGSHGVAYPSQTLYENLLGDPASLHDVGSGSNGECLQPPSEETGESTCTAAEEATQSCSSHAVCLAGAGYDGPSGVGTPDGIGAFLPLTERASEGAISTGEPPSAPQPAPGSSQPGTGTSSTPAAPTTASGSATSTAPVIGALQLTRGARAATARRRATTFSKLAFAFAISAAARVRVTLALLVRTHGHTRWRTASAPLSFLARAGSQTRALSGGTRLAAGRYRLTLTPTGGAARTLTFTVH